MTLTPTREKALIQFEPIVQISDGGIILNEGVPWPGAEDQDYRFGIVLAIGPGRITRKGVELPAEFNIGDRVLVADYHTTSTGRKDRHFCGHEDVLAILEAA